MPKSTGDEKNTPSESSTTAQRWRSDQPSTAK
jgi:hypothetical protein